MDIEESEEEMDTAENRKRPCEDSDEDAIAPAGSSSMITNTSLLPTSPLTVLDYKIHQDIYQQAWKAISSGIV